MPVNPFRGIFSTTPDTTGYWPTSFDAPTPEQPLNYFDAVGILHRRKQANNFLNQRQQQLEDQGAFVHPPQTVSVTDSQRMEADEEYRNALIEIRKRYENTKGLLADNIREAEFENNKAELEKWYKARTTATLPGYKDPEEAKRYLTWKDTKRHPNLMSNQEVEALDHAANDPFANNSGVSSYKKLLEDQRQWAEMIGRRDLAHKYLQQSLSFDPTNGISIDPLDPEAQEDLSRQWDTKAQTERANWEGKIEKEARQRNAKEDIDNNANLGNLLNEGLDTATEGDFFTFGSIQDRFYAIRDRFGDKWTYAHTEAWEAKVRKAFRNKKAAEEIQKADPLTANAARWEARSRVEEKNRIRRKRGKPNLPVTAVDVLNRLEDIVKDNKEYYDKLSNRPPRPDESNWSAPPRSPMHLGFQLQNILKHGIGSSRTHGPLSSPSGGGGGWGDPATLKEAQAEWDEQYKNLEMPPKLAKRIRPVSTALQIDRALQNYEGYSYIQGDPVPTGYEGFQKEIAGQMGVQEHLARGGTIDSYMASFEPMGRVEYLTRQVMAFSPDLSAEEASSIAEKAVEENNTSDKMKQDLDRLIESDIAIFRQGEEKVPAPMDATGYNPYEGMQLKPEYAEVRERNRQLREDKTESARKVQDSFEALKIRFESFNDRHSLQDLQKMQNKHYAVVLADEVERARQDAVHAQALQYDIPGAEPFGTKAQGLYSVENRRGYIPRGLSMHEYEAIVRSTGEWASINPIAAFAHATAQSIFSGAKFRADIGDTGLSIDGSAIHGFIADSDIGKTITNDILSPVAEASLNIVKAGWNAAALVEEAFRQNPNGWLRENIVNDLVRATDIINLTASEMD